MSKKFLFCWIIGTLILFSILFMISGVNAQPTDNDDPKPKPPGPPPEPWAPEEEREKWRQKKIEWEIYREKKMREVEGDLNDASNEIRKDLRVLKGLDIVTGAAPVPTFMNPNWMATKEKLEDAQEKIDNVNTEIGYVTEGRWVPPLTTPTRSGKREKVKEPLTDKKKSTNGFPN